MFRSESGVIGGMYDQVAKHPGFDQRVVKGFAYLKDFKDMRSTLDVPPEVRAEGDLSKLRELMVSEQQQARLLALTEHFEVGKTYRARQRVGSVKKKNIHPHDFVVEKGPDHTNLYFVDPEISLLSKVRPKAVYLESIRLYADGRPPEVAIFRCRSQQLSDKQAMKADPLLMEARNLIDNEGIPNFLRDQFKGDIAIRIVVRQSEAVAQIREDLTVNKKTMNAFLTGQVKSPIISGIVHSHQLRMHQFESLLTDHQKTMQADQPPRFTVVNNDRLVSPADLKEQ